MRLLDPDPVPYERVEPLAWIVRGGWMGVRLNRKGLRKEGVDDGGFLDVGLDEGMRPAEGEHAHRGGGGGADAGKSDKCFRRRPQSPSWPATTSWAARWSSTRGGEEPSPRPGTENVGDRRAESASTLGSHARNSAYFEMTPTTWVCWSMTSDTRISSQAWCGAKAGRDGEARGGPIRRRRRRPFVARAAEERSRRQEAPNGALMAWPHDLSAALGPKFDRSLSPIR